jgi:hypothetical protein
MLRDNLAGRYYLEQNGKDLPLTEAHFQPVFTARKVDDLRSDPDAQNALKQYQIFVGPNEFVNNLKTK